MTTKPATPEAYKLFHDGVIALANVEQNGIRIDTKYLDKKIEQTSRRIKKGEDKLKSSKIWTRWKRKFRNRSKLGSKEQLAEIIFGEMGYDCPTRTKTGRYKSDEAAFAKVDLPFVKTYFKVEKLKKANGTYLKGIRREVCGEILRPFFNLHTVKTYRGSCDRVNFQNMPMHNDEMRKLIRDAVIPREGHVIVEMDYSGLEFTIVGCVTQDPAIKKYIERKGDPHRDMAALVFITEPEDVSKGMRFCGKNQFVFPLLYGSYYRSCAPIIWQSIADKKLELNGTSLYDHLADHGITELGALDRKGNTTPGTFEHHLKECEHEYTKVLFKKCFKEQHKAYKNYLKTGQVRYTTGFVRSGKLSRNDVFNSRIQGPAFHCLLWSLIQLNKWLVKSRMRSMIVGQIHDSIVMDVHVDELEDVLSYSNYIMTQEIREHWDWLYVPLAADIEVTPEGGTWNDKKAYTL